MKGFHLLLSKNKTIQKVVSSVLVFSLFVTSVTPVNVFAGKPNGAAGSGTASTGGAMQSNGGTIDTAKGGYRFSLIFLDGNIDGGIFDSVGNTNIDKWAEYTDQIQVIGSLDVYKDGCDDLSSIASYGLADDDGKSSFVLFDYKGYNRASNRLTPSERNAISASSLGLTGFRWEFNTGGAFDVTTILAEQDGTEKVNMEMYPSNPEGQRIVEGYKYKLTDNCQKLINELCVKSGVTGEDAVFCETAPMVNGETHKNSFERGTYNGANGSYRLMIEPYCITNLPTGGKLAMTLRDCIWYANNGNNGEDWVWNTGNFSSLLANVAYMPRKDILNINTGNEFGYEPGVLWDNYHSLNAIDFNYLKNTLGYGSRRKFEHVGEQVGLKHHGYGISSISSEMTKVPTIGLYIGSVNNVFLPGTLSVNGSINTETESYSLEYRGQKVANYEEALAKDAEKLMNIVIKAATESDIASVKNGIVTFNTTAFEPSSGKIRETYYKALTDKVVFDNKQTPINIQL